MATDREKDQLRKSIGRLLKSEACLNIRFKLENVCIQRYMYTYIGHAIANDTVHIDVGGGNSHYDHTKNLLTLESLDVNPATVVHESTHALINATHVGKVVTKGVHEVAGYLAETIWALNTGNDVSVDVPPLLVPMIRLAHRVVDSNARGGLFTVPPEDSCRMQLILQNSSLGMEVNRKDLQVGIGDGPK